MIAFELSNASLASFEASAEYNGFRKAITLHKVILCPGTTLCLIDRSGNMIRTPAGAEDFRMPDLITNLTSCSSPALGRVRTPLVGRCYRVGACLRVAHKAKQ